MGTLFGWVLALGKLIWRVLSAIFTWATSDWRHAAIIMLAAIALVQTFHTVPSLQSRVADRTAERDDERTAHQQTKADYREAQVEAERQETARLTRVRQEQQEITDAVEADYRRQLAGLHARAEQLRGQILRAGAGSAGAGQSGAMPGFSDASSGPAEAAGNDGLPAAFDRSAAGQLERDIVATEQAIQLNSLIDWILKQGAIDPNAAEGIE
ncbi:hypothetical protein IT881_15120 [Erythrobacter sp. A30-3]|nr:hypothetical protein IT881_15120 [Erythrobacter sp. A30-3]